MREFIVTYKMDGRTKPVELICKAVSNVHAKQVAVDLYDIPEESIIQIRKVRKKRAPNKKKATD